MMYELFLHYKQGDDFNLHLEHTKSVADAFGNWAEHFKANKEVCEELAISLKGINVQVYSDNHMISIEPKDKNAEAVLERLAEFGILHRLENWGEDDDPDYTSEEG